MIAGNLDAFGEGVADRVVVGGLQPDAVLALDRV
jgi:hypothetical protein